MSNTCSVCGTETTPNDSSAPGGITSGICAACVLQLSATSNMHGLLEAIDAPVLLMQGNPRQVVSANQRALDLFQKPLRAVADHRGGQVFDCVHSFSEAGCGKDPNCEDCKIRNAIVDTFDSANPHSGVSTSLQLNKADGTHAYVVQVSTEKLGDLALVRVERYENEA